MRLPLPARFRAAAALVMAAVLLLPGLEAARAEEDVDACRQAVRRVHEAVEQAGVKNAAAASVRGFSYLRADRFLAAMEGRAKSAEAVAAWMGRMRTLDRKARAVEIFALPSADLKRLAGQFGIAPDPKVVHKHYENCADVLLAANLSEEGFPAQVRRNASVPGEYRLGYRIVGLYPLTAMAVAAVTRRVYDEYRSWHRTERSKLPTVGKLVTYAPEGPRPPPGSFGLDVLGVPAPTPDQADALIRHFAPVFVVDHAYEFDRPGAVGLRDGRPRIEDGPPVVYTYLSNAFYRDTPVLQLNYAIWFAARGGERAPWIEHGRLDGLTVRVTLGPRGRPVVVDVMNNCGCYHFFLPAAGLVSRLRDDPSGLEPLVAGTLPEGFPDRRLWLRVNAGWHQVDSVWTAPAPPANGAVFYRTAPYVALEGIPTPDGGTESLFRPDGIAKGTGRIEPLVLFSMGIPDVGSMRQRGHHAIKLVGRAHFDDPYLLDETFAWR